MTAQVAADLRAAAEVLKRDGWTQRVMYGPDNTCCAVGAIHRVTDSLSAIDARVAMNSYVGGSVAAWNDAPGRTADEVIAAMLAAALAEEATP